MPRGERMAERGSDSLPVRRSAVRLAALRPACIGLRRSLSRALRHAGGCLLLATGALALGAAESPAPLIAPANRIAPDAPEWRELAAQFEKRGDTTAEFEERRFFPFRNEPVVLRGESRVSAAHGLSLHYTAPQERIVILDAQGLVTREPEGHNSAPPDPRANAAVEPLRHILRFDFAKLAEGYELYGRREAAAWSLALVPRDAAQRRALGDIYVDGDSDAVRRIELRRSAKQHIDIAIGPPRPAAPFTADEVRQYFR